MAKHRITGADDLVQRNQGRLPKQMTFKMRALTLEEI